MKNRASEIMKNCQRRWLLGFSNGLYMIDPDSETPRLLLKGVQPTALAADPAQPTRLFCSTYNRGLWRSEDMGETWFPAGTPQNYYGSPVPEAIGPRETTFVSLSPQSDQNGRHAVWVGTELSALYRSDDAGDTFQLVTNFDAMASRADWSFPPRPETHHVRAIAHDSNGNIYISVEFGALLRSEDGGLSFEDRRSDSPLDTHSLLTHPQAPGKVFAALGDGLMDKKRAYAESSDGGRTWRYRSRGLEQMPYLYFMAVNPENPDDVIVSAAPGPRAAHGAPEAANNIKSTNAPVLKGGPVAIFRLSGELWSRFDDGFPGENSLIPTLSVDPHQPGYWYALSNQGFYSRGPDDHEWSRITMRDEWKSMHPMCLLAIG